MKRCLLFIFIFVVTSCLMAQSLDETIQNLSGDAAKAYVDPMVSVFGANMNGAWFHQAPKAKLFDWDLEISAVFMASAFKNKED